jgi:hypothetical protein
MNTLVTYLSEFALIWTALMLAWTFTRTTVRNHSVGVVRNEIEARSPPAPNRPPSRGARGMNTRAAV